MKKRVLASILSLAMFLVLCAGMLPVVVSAAGDGVSPFDEGLAVTKSTFAAGWGALAVKTDGTLWYSRRETTTPEEFSNIKNAVEVAVVAGDFGYEGYYILRSDKTLWYICSYSEGYNPSEPEKVKDNIIHISGSSAIDANNDLWTRDEYGNYTKVMSGVADVTSNAQFALKTDGSVWSLKSNSKVMDGVIQIDSPPVWYGAVLYALKNDGSMWVWGCSPSNYGNAGIPYYVEGEDPDSGEVSSYIAYYDISTPYRMAEGITSFSCGVIGLLVKKSDNSMWLWSGGAERQVDLGNDVLHFSCAAGYSGGNEYAVFIKSDGSLWKYTPNLAPVKVMDGVVLPDLAPGPDAIPIFTDVKTTDWYYDAVVYANERGLMTGTSAAIFSPNTTLNRAMLATLLYRLDGAAVTYRSVFTDVPSGQWYSEAITWAADNNIVGVSRNTVT